MAKSAPTWFRTRSRIRRNSANCRLAKSVKGSSAGRDKGIISRSNGEATDHDRSKSLGVRPVFRNGVLYSTNSANGNISPHSPGNDLKTSATKSPNKICSSMCTLSTGACAVGCHAGPNCCRHPMSAVSSDIMAFITSLPLSDRSNTGIVPFLKMALVKARLNCG